MERILVLYLFTLSCGTIFITGVTQELSNQRSDFVVSGCCDNQTKCGQMLITESFQLPHKFFKTKVPNGHLSVETNSVQPCDGEVEYIKINLRSEVSLPRKSDGFYGRNKIWLDGRSYSRKDFCVSKITDEEMSLKVCKRECSKDSPCIQRCCSRERVWNFTDVNSPKCVEKTGKLWNPLANRTSNQPTFIKPDHLNGPCIYFTENKVPQNISVVYKRQIDADGSVWFKLRRRNWIRFEEGQYCLEYTEDSPWDSTGLELSRNNYVVLTCGESKEASIPGVHLMVKGIVLVAFSMFYALTCVVYFVLKDKDPVHRWTVIALTATMTLNFILSGLNKFSFQFLPTTPAGEYLSLCTVIGITSSFTFLYALNWLTVANFDIWLTFRFLKPGKRSARRLWVYSAVTLLVPLAIIGTGVILDVIYLDDMESDVITPQYGSVVCNEEPVYAPWIYTFGPFGVILIINFALYISTGVSVLRAKSQTTFARSMSTQTQSARDSFVLFLRLSLVMGIPWVAEMIDWLLLPDDYKDTQWYSHVLEFITFTQPAFTFYILVLKKDVNKGLVPKWPWIGRLWGCNLFGRLSQLCHTPGDASQDVSSVNNSNSNRTNETNVSSNSNIEAHELKTQEKSNGD